MSSWDTNPWSNFCDPHWEFICRNKWHPGTSEISTAPEIAVGTHFHVHNVALKLFLYFYLLMEKPLGHYFQVRSPYYQAAQCNQKTAIPVSSLEVTGQVWERLLVYSYSAANKGRLTVDYRQSLAFDWPYLSCDDHCDQWLFQEIFLSLSFSFHRNSLEWSWTCFLEIVKHSKQFSIPYSRVDI